MSAGTSLPYRFPTSSGPSNSAVRLWSLQPASAAAHRLVWVLMITAAANRGWPDDVVIDDHGAAGLPIPSVVRTAKIATLEATTAEKIGAIAARNAAEVLAILKRLS